jgi:KinB signaling pathway activation protein
MTIGNWLRMFISTLAVGIVVSMLFGFIQQIADPELTLWDVGWVILYLLSGALYSVLSQLGFFAYMTLNYYATDIFRRKTVWFYVQWICVFLGFAYLIGIRAVFFEENNHGWLAYSVLPVVLMAASVLAAWYKTKLTNATAFTPTVFFLFVVTALELVPALRQNNALSTASMAIPLFACNAWQILNLHHYVKKREEPAAAKPGVPSK